MLLTLALALCSCEALNELLADNLGALATPPAHTHNFANWKTTLTATCTEDGAIEGECSCGEKKTDTLAATGHNFADGLCSVCGTNEETQTPDEPTVRTPSEGLEFMSLGEIDGVTYAGVIGIGSCTDTEIVFPETTPNGVKIIGIYAEVGGIQLEGSLFENCTEVTKIVIPASYQMVLINAFDNFTSLETIVFEGCRTAIYGSTGTFAMDISGCNSLSEIIVESDANKADQNLYIGDRYFFSSVDGNLYATETTDEESKKYLVKYAPAKTETSFIIPDDVTAIVPCALDCAALTNIEVSENHPTLTSIDGNLYSKDGTTLISYAPGKAETIFTIPDSVTKVYRFAFRNCTSITNVVIPNGVEEIDYCTFNDCTSLTSIVIPSSVREIRSHAFVGCTSLTNIYYTGSEEEWSSISISSYNEFLTSSTIHYNYVPEE